MAGGSRQSGHAFADPVRRTQLSPLTALAEAARRSGATTVGGAPEGYVGLLLGGVAARSDRPILHVCRDDARLSRLAEALAFFAPDVPVLSLPAWDCLPYDRVSPNAELVARRLATLAALSRGADAPLVVLTTVSAALQRLPPPAVFEGTVIDLRVGAQLPQDTMLAFFARNGYRRAGTVREPGEYAIRGGIVDVFPPSAASPVRLDFFGDEIESLRSFDAMTQRTIGEAEGLRLMPVSELMLDEEAVRLFRHRYREMFGVATEKDPLYEAVSAGQRYPGLEHWLPLFHESLVTVFDYLPEATIGLDHVVEAAVEARLELIDDYYRARRDMLPANQRSAEGEGAPVYKPVPPETMFLDIAAWRQRLDERPVLAFSPFDAPPTDGTVDAGARPAPDFAEARARPDRTPYDAVRELVGREAERTVIILAHSAGSRERIGTLLAEHGVDNASHAERWTDAATRPPGSACLAVLDLESGFATDRYIVLSEQDILGERLARPPRRRRRAEQFISEVSTLSRGDLVVHVDHGIGRYDGLETLVVSGAPHDCLRIVYAGDDRLYVPVENIEVLSRYGSEEAFVQLDRLGAPAWQARKARVKERLREMAEQLLRVAAERATARGEVMEPSSGAFDAFCARFAWTETEDQQQAIDDVVMDLGSGRSMDRLVCGDVGFGKTEVALRAAFIAATAGVQVAVVVPTTLLAYQHHRTFTERFAGHSLRIEQLSRLVTGARAAEVRRGLADGSVNIVIGTHALLAKSITFSHLGLLIVDEEQHFGVAQKERLKQLRANVHVLTLTATPIPRTLQMALAGVREMSIIATPPVDRLAVRTFVLPYDPVIVREAIQREKFRGGQTFYVCPRIADLGRVHERLRKLVPEARVAVAHGQMATRALESVMTGFSNGEYDVLLATNIVEAGLDIPTANTLIVHRSDRFGLAQLYQLRGRIGRSKVRAYAYLTLPPGQVVSEAAQKRLSVMQALDTLGAGFTVASHDLDIRGAGNLLGEEQSGHVKEVGVELYQQMLEEAVARLRSGAEGDVAVEPWSPQITLGTSVLIPESYVADLSVRLGLYRRLAVLQSREEIDALAVEMVDRFGPLPIEVKNLLEVIEIKQLCRASGVEKIDAGPKGAVFSFHNNTFANPAGLIGLIQKEATAMRVRPDHSVVYRSNWSTPEARLSGVRQLVAKLAAIARPA